MMFIVAEQLTAVKAMRNRTVQVVADPNLGVVLGDDGGKAPQQVSPPLSGNSIGRAANARTAANCRTM